MADEKLSTQERHLVAFGNEDLSQALVTLSAAYNNSGEPWRLGFVVLVYATLMALTFSLRRRENQSSERLRVAVWALITVIRQGHLLEFATAAPAGLPAGIASALDFVSSVLSLMMAYMN